MLLRGIVRHELWSHSSIDGLEEEWTIPEGVNALTIRMHGATGGHYPAGSSGYYHILEGQGCPVVAGNPVLIKLGGNAVGLDGGWNGGGSGTTAQMIVDNHDDFYKEYDLFGAGGGGSSEIYIDGEMYGVAGGFFGDTVNYVDGVLLEGGYGRDVSSYGIIFAYVFREHGDPVPGATEDPRCVFPIEDYGYGTTGSPNPGGIRNGGDASTIAQTASFVSGEGLNGAGGGGYGGGSAGFFEYYDSDNATVGGPGRAGGNLRYPTSDRYSPGLPAEPFGFNPSRLDIWWFDLIPTAIITGPAVFYEDEEVVFSAADSWSANHEIVSYEWWLAPLIAGVDFELVGTDVECHLTIEDAGNYYLVLIATDDQGTANYARVSAGSTHTFVDFPGSDYTSVEGEPASWRTLEVHSPWTVGAVGFL